MRDLGNKVIMARNIKRLMSEKNVSAKEMSKTLHFPYTTLLSWMKAENYPRIDKIEAMADYFGALKSQMIFQQGVPHDSLYQMPFGALLLTVTATRLFYDIVPDGGVIDLRYNISIENTESGVIDYHLDIFAKS